MIIRRTLALLAGGAFALVLAACGTPSTTAGGASNAATAGGPVITAFHVIEDLHCTGATAEVPASWSIRDTTKVEVQVDGKAAAGNFAVNGSAKVPVPCSGKEHKVALVATGGGKETAVARHVNTKNTPATAVPAPNVPVITSFHVIEAVTCGTEPTVKVAAAWKTQNASKISFAVDGTTSPEATLLPPSGAAEITVPCDGKDHKVSLIAEGANAQSVTQSHSVNTVKP